MIDWDAMDGSAAILLSAGNGANTPPRPKVPLLWNSELFLYLLALPRSSESSNSLCSLQLCPKLSWRKLMLRGFLRFSILVGCISSAYVTAAAQEVIHALSGTARFVDTAAKTITVDTDDGSEGIFKVVADPTTTFKFDRKISAGATAADTFKKEGARVIVYYIGNGDERTAVALQDLGTGPFTKVNGTVVNFESKGRWFTVKDEKGAVLSFEIASGTVVETGFGAMEGFKAQIKKGDQVQVIGTTAAKSAVALFVSAL